MTLALPYTRLHLGCGSHQLEGWVNVDGVKGPSVDHVLDIHGGLWQLPSGYFEWIYASHVIEHVYPDKLPGVLRELHRSLASGGRLTLATTDFEGIYRNRFASDANGTTWECALFGLTDSHSHPMDAHRDCFTYAKLERLLLAAGFASVRTWRTEDYPEIHALYDYARTCEPVTCYAEGRKA